VNEVKVDVMTQFGGSLRFVQISAVAELLAGLGATGRLYLKQGDWTGDLVLREGLIIGASLGTERGRAAFESIVLGLTCAEFSFVDEPVGADGKPLVDEAERSAYMNALKDDRERFEQLIPTLSSVPRLVNRPVEGLGEGQVTIGRATLTLIPVLVSGQTLEGLAHERGLGRTLRDVAALVQGGLVRLEEGPPVPAAPAIAEPQQELESARERVEPARRPEPLTPAPLRPPRLDSAAQWWVPETPATTGPLASLRAAVVNFFLIDEPPKPVDRLRRFQALPDAPQRRASL
jgi:hypothetical protein